MGRKRYVVLATLILALGTAVYINWRMSDSAVRPASVSTPTASTASETARLGDVLYVNGSVTASESENVQFAEAKLAREKARDEATVLLKSVLEAAESTETARKEAVLQAAELAKQITQETQIESLLKAKGYEKCLAYLNQANASVLVQSDGLQTHETVTIQDIVHRSCGAAYEDIVIVEVP